LPSEAVGGMKHFAGRIARRLGLRGSGIVDLRQGGDVASVLQAGRVALLDLPLSAGIGLHHFALDDVALHPFARATKRALANPSASLEGAVSGSLREYYEQCQPRSAADWLGLPKRLQGLLGSMPPWSTIFPWQGGSPESWQKQREDGVPLENKLAGRALSIGDGWHACGPVSKDKLGIETSRLATLVRSIQTSGLLRNDDRDGDLGAVLIRGAGVEKWWLNFGHHRSAVFAALGYSRIPVRISAVIDADSPQRLPQVQSGLFSERDASEIIDRLLGGRLPPVLEAWATFARTSACE
jgi:hypothetical protein